MAKKSKHKFPQEVVVSMGGPSTSPYLTLHKDGINHIGSDTIVGVYVLKKVSLVRIKRKLEKLR
jgi:hypothetical protein